MLHVLAACKPFIEQVWLPGMDSNHDNHKHRRICNLQRFNGLKCRIGPEKPTLVHNSYTAGSNPATLALAPGSATSAGCGDRVTRRNYLGSQVLLREMFLVQRGNERGTPLLRAGAECVVVRIWGKVVLASNGHELCLLPQPG
jgi:hypothetical protein